MENILISELIWNRIVENEGKKFHQIRGKEFSYKIENDYIHLETTNRSIPKKDIVSAISFCPLKNTEKVQHLQAPSYIYAIMMDERICGKLW